MIGAMIAKRKVRSAFETLSSQNVLAFLDYWTDDGMLTYPSPDGPGFGEDQFPVIEGKEAIKEWYQASIEPWEVSSYTIKNISATKHCPLVFGTNVVMVEWELKLVAKKDAKESETTGISVITMNNGKIAEVRNYDCLKDTVCRAIESKLRMKKSSIIF